MQEPITAPSRWTIRRLVPLLMVPVALSLCSNTVRAAEDQADSTALARRILDATGVTGGLVVHLGCGDGSLTAALKAGDGFLVHGLERDVQRVRTARQRIEALGHYGEVSIDRLRGKTLPYVDNLVNLVVTTRPTDVPLDEILRVLAPGGSAYLRAEDGWKLHVKPRPEALDEWTHYMHDPSGNAVAHDSVVAPPRHFQWIGSPKWSRHHDHMSSVSGLVSSGGRLFYIFDEGPAASIQLPAKWSLIARDAFNGTVLWKRSIDEWFTHIWPLKSGPAQLPRRLVAMGDRVYATLGIRAPLSALDAATGETVRTYEGTRSTEEVLVSDGVVFALVNESPLDRNRYKPVNMICWDETGGVARDLPWNGQPRSIVALDAETGETIWRRDSVVVPLTLAADGGKVYFHDGERVVALDRSSGDDLWKSEPVATRSPLPVSYAPTLVVHDDVVIFAGGRPAGKIKQKAMTAISAKDGQTLWAAPHPRAGHHSPEDVLVIDGLVWSAPIAGGGDSGVWKGRDLHTGEVKVEFPPDVSTYWFHHRCYRSKATENFLLPSRTGVEFVDFRQEHWIPHHWFRGACVYGIMPCNGLVYAPQHPCACYLEAKLSGFCALAPASSSRPRMLAQAKTDRLEKGPAYDEPITAAESAPEESWPTYRGNPERSGSTRASVGEKLEATWSAELGGKLSGVVISDGLLFVAQVDRHKVFALDASTGKVRWSFTAGGRVDSPPTVHEGRALFGCADGFVYCLRARDGALIWRFRAAPVDLRLVSFEQVESVWPVHGSPLVQDGILYCVAGRSSFVDGGLRLLRLDPGTGKLISETVLDERANPSEKDLQDYVAVLNMPVALPDILSSDGEHVYMRSQRFDLEGRREQIAPQSDRPFDRAAEQIGEGRHLFCPTGFLDDSWWHRTYWLYGKTFSSGCNWWFRAGRFAPAGRILVFDDSSIYGFGRQPEYFVWSHVLEYHLFGASRQVDEEAIEHALAANQRIEKQQRRAIFNRSVTRSVPLADLTAVKLRWSMRSPPFWARAMVLADRKLFVAGPPDVVDETEIYERREEEEVRRRIEAQMAALEGRSGARLWVVSAEGGAKLAEYELDALPVWDGMAATPGRIFIAMADGSVRCLRGE